MNVFKFLAEFIRAGEEIDAANVQSMTLDETGRGTVRTATRTYLVQVNPNGKTVVGDTIKFTGPDGLRDAIKMMGEKK
jgi:hypothetical protein